MSETRTLEELLEAGEVRSALILKSDFTDAERDLIRRAYEAGTKVGQCEREQFAAALRRIDRRLTATGGSLSPRHSDHWEARKIAREALSLAGEPRD